MTRRFGPHELDDAAELLNGGGVLAYPTEAVFGLGSDPLNAAAVGRLYAIKGRSRSQGFLLIAAEIRQLDEIVDWSLLPGDLRVTVCNSWPGPTTWILPRCESLPPALTGAHRGIAVRVTSHPVAAELCRRFGRPFISTSANQHGARPAITVSDVLEQFPHCVLDGIVDAPLGGLGRPTTIKDALTGCVVRPC